DRAEYALTRASSLFALGAVRQRFGEVDRPDPHDATGLLRDLALHKNELEGSDRRRAKSILARPTDGASDPQNDGYKPSANVKTQCYDHDGDSMTAEVCFNWVTSTSDAVSPADTNANQIPDFVDAASYSMVDVWQKEIVDLGFRRPQSDANSKNNGSTTEEGQVGALDVYLADIGDDGLYGYCTTDEPGAATKKTVSAYCVIDNDYDPSQYSAPRPEVSGEQALQVTLAHEFFHAIQFNYDWREALFLMEGTAVWMENEVYDGIDASYAYIFDSALHQPEIPLDAYQGGNDDENFEYGAFVFFTWLSEVYGPGWPGSDPTIVREVWEQAGGTKRGIGAVKAAVTNGDWDAADSGVTPYPGPSTPFRDFFAEWGAANYWYDAYYEEGYLDGGPCQFKPNSYFHTLRCFRPPTDGQFVLGADNAKTGWRSLPMDRLSTRYVEMFPGGPAATNQLKVWVDLPAKARGGEATILKLSPEGYPSTTRIKLNADGDGSKTVPFKGSVYTVHLVLSNTGSNNNETYKYKAEVIS
ncbi:MAG: hypothetical protein M3198_11475, partial [Actinomycetota bacterium]|nr:hypothetical protein [Actinomycetota bacterium]